MSYDDTLDRISELEKNMSAVQNPNWNNDLKFNLNKEIDELRDLMLEHIKEIHIRNHNQAEKVENQLNELKENCKMCKDCNLYPFRDSGGEKELVELDQVGSIPSAFQGARRDSALSADSKPPEPIDCDNCKHSFEQTGNWCGNKVGLCLLGTHYEPIEDRLPGGTGTEPREDYEFVSEDDMVNYFKKRGKDVVKREDLQLLSNIILNNGFMNDIEKRMYFKIKEEYNIE